MTSASNSTFGTSFKLVVNAVEVSVRADQRGKIAAEPGVLAVLPVREFVAAGIGSDVIPGLGAAVRPLAESGESAGAGTTVALLDGPIDAGHPYLGGRVTVIGDGATAGDASADHATAMAGIVAGLGGPDGLRGVAPGASILSIPVLAWRDGALRGSTVDLLRGLERAADPNGDGDTTDHADVALVAASAPFAAFAQSAEAVAVRGLGLLGTSVVAAAGNDGPTGARFGSIGSPASAAEAIAVAARDLRDAVPTVDLQVAGAAAPVSAALVGALAPAEGLRAEVAVATDASNVAAFAGRAVLTARGTRDIRAAVRTAAAAGAVVVIVDAANIAAGALGVDERGAIPVIALSAEAASALRESVAAGAPASVTFGASRYIERDDSGSIAAFSSSGPRYDGLLKPDLALPGVTIATAIAGGGFTTVTGTSAASAQAAGLVAALRERQPSWTPAEVRSALIGTAQPVNGSTSGLAPVEQQGAGAPNVAAAQAAQLVASPASITFDATEIGACVDGDGRAAQPIRSAPGHRARVPAGLRDAAGCRRRQRGRALPDAGSR